MSEKNQDNYSTCSIELVNETVEENIFSEEIFFLKYAEQLSEIRLQNIQSITQMVLNLLNIPLIEKQTLQNEIAEEAESSLAKLFLKKEEASIIQEIRKKFYIQWSNVTLSNLQLLNAVKMCVVENELGAGGVLFFQSLQANLDLELVNQFYYTIRGLKIESTVLREIIPCLPLKGEGVKQVLEEFDKVWHNICATILNNFPLDGFKKQELSLLQIIRCLVVVLKNSNVEFNPSKNFKNFSFQNQKYTSYLSSSSSEYKNNLFEFYESHLRNHDCWWLFLDGISDNLSENERYNTFSLLKV